MKRLHITTVSVPLLVIWCFLASASVTAKEAKKKVESLGEVSIIGNTELPNVTFSLPWRLPSIERREDQSPPKELAGVFEPVEPRRHQQQVHFSRYLQVDQVEFSAK